MITFQIMAEEDAHELILQPEQEHVTPTAILQQPGEKWAFRHNGRLICIAGAIELTPGRAWVWALLSKDAPMIALTRYLSIFIEELGFRRVEMYVRSGFQKGCRWAKILGFRRETEQPMLGFFEDGTGAYLYGRVY